MATRPSSRMARNWRKPGALLAKEVLGRHPAPVEPQSVGIRGVPAHLSVRRLDHESRRVPAGTTIAEMSVPVRAVTVMIDVIGVPEFVMNALAPSITHSPSVRVARVRVAPASLPASGSVRPNAPSRRPAQRSGSHCWRCASVPNR